PAALPTGTRPDAIPPAAAPSANGVSTDETADAESIITTCRCDDAPERSAYAKPRTMIPSPATNRATQSVEAIEPKPVGYDVHSPVSTKISHTWLASPRGAIALWACSRSFSSRVVACQPAAPKSAPPSTT